jgi:ribosomal protein S18 acetylase RimI-like enzyme
VLIQNRPTIVPLGRHHDRKSFSCGIEVLDRYIKEQASQDVKRRVSRVFVATMDDPGIVAGYYSLSAASVELEGLPEKERKKLPRYPVPVARIGRLAVDGKMQGRGLGAFLLMDAVDKIMAASEVVAIYAVIVDATDAAANAFYEKYGFRSFPGQNLRLFLDLETLHRTMT